MVFLICFVVYLLTATYGVAQINDARAATQTAYALATTGSFALPESWDAEADWQVQGLDGRKYTNRFPLMAVYAAAFHSVADVVSTDKRPKHPHLISYAPSGVAAAMATAGAVTVSFLLFRKLAGRRLALIATGALGFGTAVWTVSADALWPHGLTHLFLALGVLAAAGGWSGRSGIAFGVALLARPHLAVVPAVVGLWNGAVRRDFRPVLAIGATSGLGLAAVIAYSRLFFGTWLPIAGYNTYAVDNLTGLTVVEYGERIVLAMGDPVRGLFIYVPALFVLVPFVGRGWRVSPWWARAAAVSGVLYLLVQLRANAHHGGAQFFGSRLTIETLVLVAPLLLRTYQAYHPGRRWATPALHVLLVLGVALHALGATVWKQPFVDVEESWEQRVVEICSDERYDVGCTDEHLGSGADP